MAATQHPPGSIGWGGIGEGARLAQPGAAHARARTPHGHAADLQADTADAGMTSGRWLSIHRLGGDRS